MLEQWVFIRFLEAKTSKSSPIYIQATLLGFTSNGLSIEEGESLLRKSVRLACEARDSFWETLHKVSVRNSKYSRALVAASIGSYGAYLADGSEYRYSSFHNPFPILVKASGHSGPFLLKVHSLAGCELMF